MLEGEFIRVKKIFNTWQEKVAIIHEIKILFEKLRRQTKENLKFEADDEMIQKAYCTAAVYNSSGQRKRTLSRMLLYLGYVWTGDFWRGKEGSWGKGL